MYLGGTIHVLKPSDYPLPVEFEHAYQRSQTLVFETDITAGKDAQSQQTIIQNMLAAPDEVANNVLTPQTYGLLMRTFGKYGMSLSDMRPFKVSMMVLTLSIAEMRRLGISEEGVDHHFYHQAREDDKAIRQLESFEQQVEFLARMGKGNEESFVAMSLRDLDKTGSMIGDMTHSWRNGDMDAMSRLFVNDMKKDYPEIHQQLLVNRNNNWIPGITALFDQPGTEFVLVGVGHMVGESGLLAQLQERGYQVEPLTPPVTTSQ